MRPIQNTMFPMVLLRLTMGSLPSAIIGSWAICTSSRQPRPSFRAGSSSQTSPSRALLTRRGKAQGRRVRMATHLHQEEVRPDLLGHYSHDQFVAQRRQQESDECGRGAGQLEPIHRGRVDMPQEEGLPEWVSLPVSPARVRGRGRPTCTGLFHLRANSSHVVEFHQSM
jgi:hypothetical protein